jgi:LPS sulfotransferase NodH
MKIKDTLHNIYYAAIGKWSGQAGSRFIIYAQGRSGSTALADLLDNHPSIRCEEELLIGKKLLPRLFLEGKSHSHIQDGRSWGCKIKWWHISKNQNKNAKEFIEGLCNKDWKIIYLHRENYLFQALSTLAGEARAEWRHKHGEKVKAVDIDAEKIGDYVEYRRDQTEMEIKTLSNVPYEKVIYERDLLNQENHQRTVDRICEFLGLPPCSVTTTYKKTGGANLEKYANNHEEVRRKIRELGLEHWLQNKALDQ